MDDLPLIKYSVEKNKMKFWYNENVISTLEIVNHVAAQTVIAGMQVISPGLEDVILMRREEAGL